MFIYIRRFPTGGHLESAILDLKIFFKPLKDKFSQLCNQNQQENTKMFDVSQVRPPTHAKKKNLKEREVIDIYSGGRLWTTELILGYYLPPVKSLNYQHLI